MGKRGAAFVSIVVIGVLSACSTSSPGGSGTPRAAVPASGVLPSVRRPPARVFSADNTITHIVVIVQENRSFVNFFAGYPGADAPMSGKMHDGKTVALQPISMLTGDIDHSYAASIQDYDGGKMDGFDRDGKAGHLAYSYIMRGQVAPYWSMARRYTLADRMFETEHGPSWTAHISLIAGTTNLSPERALVDFPNSYPFDCMAPPGTQSAFITASGRYQVNGPYPCFTQFATMADTLDAAGLSWRYYAASIGKRGIGGFWSPFAAIRNVRHGRDWANVITPPSRVLTDIAAGDLANVTWVTPEWQYSDHAGIGTAVEGPSWVASVVNAIGESRFWNNTAIVVLWDDWGGWYDDAVPPQLDFRGLGLRVPCIIISPYARAGYVSHTQYEFGSILAFVEQTFALPTLGPASAGYTDGRANSIIDSFNFSQPPIPFRPIAAPYKGPFFVHMAASGKLPDDE